MAQRPRLARHPLSLLSFILAVVIGHTALLPAVFSQDPFRVDPAGVPGPLLISGGRSSEAVLDKFVELAGGYNAKLVIVMTASPLADAAYGNEEQEARWKWYWAARGVRDVRMVHVYGREDAEEPLLAAQLDDATGVWFGGGVQTRLTDRLRGSSFEKALFAYHRRGGLIGGTSAGAAVQSQVMIARGKDRPEFDTGFDLLPGAIIDQHFLVRRRIGRLKVALEQHPGRVGFGIDEGAAVVVHNRRVEVVGDSTVTVLFSPGAGYSEKEVVLQPGSKSDFTALRRAAVARTIAPPTAAPKKSAVTEGSLVIVGGGGTPPDALAGFIRRAGGPEAPIVVLPTAMPDPLPPEDKIPEVRMFKQAGAKNVLVLTARSPEEVESAKFQQAIKQAGGVWFGGGRQWRFVDAYAGTTAVKLFHDVLARGGVIGGSSAGASIQGELLCRGNPLGNEEILCEGYDRGFGFLPGTAIDQHFSERKRLDDMLTLTKQRPNVLGIGIDEGTAMIVHGASAEVVGKGKVFFFPDGSRRDGMETPYLAVGAGKRFDLAACRAVEENAAALDGMGR